MPAKRKETKAQKDTTKPAPPTLRIVIADDHAALREGLCMIVDRESDMQVVGQACDGKQLLHLLAECVADVVVTDISMPQMHGAQAGREVKNFIRQSNFSL